MTRAKHIATLATFLGTIVLFFAPRQAIAQYHVRCALSRAIIMAQRRQMVAGPVLAAQQQAAFLRAQRYQQLALRRQMGNPALQQQLLTAQANLLFQRQLLAVLIAQERRERYLEAQRKRRASRAASQVR